MLFLAALGLAFANGANDNSKGVATLIGGKTLSVKTALYFAAVTTFLGSLAAMLLAGGLIKKFSGKGLVDAEVLAAPEFLACVGLAACLTVLMATRISMPISTTHSLVGAIAGVGLSAHALHFSALASAFVVPLLVAPLLALVLSLPLYLYFRWQRKRLGVTRNSCVCVDGQVTSLSPAAAGQVMMNGPAISVVEGDVGSCAERYDGKFVGIDAQRVLDVAHFVSAGAASFARGLNDTPKMAALLIAAGALGSGSSLLMIGVVIVLGGLLAARRVAHTMSERITTMNDGQAFTANLVTSFLVIFASRFGVPVSTTHVSCGSLFGIGLANRQVRGGVVGQILLAWVTTLPVAGMIGWVSWRILT